MIFVLALVAMSLFGIKGVNAENLSYENTNYYFYRMGKPKDYSGPLKKYTIDNSIGYCIEPGEIEGTVYSKGSIDNYGFTSTQKENIKLYAYYGYGYKNHKNINYLAAAQSLIWKEILGQDTKVIFSSEVMGKGTIYDVSRYEEEIKYLASRYRVKPSFSGKTIDVKINEETSIEDANKVLNDYEVINNNNVRIENNKIIYTKKNTAEEMIILRQKSNYNKMYFVYTGNGQDILTEGNIDFNSVVLKLTASPGSIEITKIDEETNKPLANAEFGIYDSEDNLIVSLLTDEEGKAMYDKFKDIGKYYIKELSAPEGYKLDEKKYEFEINDSDIHKITLKNGKIIVKKEEKPEIPKKQIEELPENPKTYDRTLFYKIDIIISIILLFVLKLFFKFDKIS